MDEFGHLELINETIFKALAIVSPNVFNDTWNVRELAVSAVNVQTRAKPLVRSVRNITAPSLSLLGIKYLFAITINYMRANYSCRSTHQPFN